MTYTDKRGHLFTQEARALSTVTFPFKVELYMLDLSFDSSDAP